jgi:heat shock protein HslJ
MARSRKILNVVMGVVLLTAGACTAPLIQQKITNQKLQGTQWQLAAVGAHSSEIATGGDVLVTLNFTSDHHVGGTDGCSVFEGEYDVTAWSLEIKNIRIDSIHCDSQGVILAEVHYLDLLSQAKGYHIRGNQLILWDEQGNYLLNYSRSVPPGLVGGIFVTG